MLVSGRIEAELAVQRFNNAFPVGSRVTYFKSDLEGRQVTTISGPAYIQGDNTPMAVLDGIGVALISKVEAKKDLCV